MGPIKARKTSGTGPINPMPEGIVQAVIVDVRDLGIVTGQFGPRYTVAVEFADAEGNKASRLYNGNPETKELSLHEKSNLYGDLKALLGEVPEEIGDIAALLVGKQATVFVEQYQKGEYTNAKVTKVAKPGKGQNVIPPAPETTAAPAKKAAPEKRGATTVANVQPPANVGDGTGITDADIPF